MLYFERAEEEREKENKRENGEMRENSFQTNANLFLKFLAINKETCRFAIYWLSLSRKQPIRKTVS